MCVEVKATPLGVQLRDSKDQAAEVSISTESWTAFVAGVKGGEFDLP